MVFESGADDLPLVTQVLRPDETDDTVYEEWAEGSCDSVSSRFERQLVDSVMRVGGQSAALTGFEVHHLLSNPASIPLAMMLEDLFAALTQHA